MLDPGQPDPPPPAPEPAPPEPPHTGLRRFSGAQLLISLVLLIVASPFVALMKNGDVLESVLMSLVLGAAALLVGGRRGMLVVNLALAIPAVLGRWAHHLWPHIFSGELALIAGLIFSLFAVSNILRYIMRAPGVNSEVLCAGIASYLLIGLLWGFAYLLAASMIPHSFAFNDGPPPVGGLDSFDAFYFSFSTLSTVGFGDISPVSHVARMLAVVEAMTGMLFVGVLIARLVALYSREERPADPHSDRPFWRWRL